jgi:mannitol/fructose-specific phosphotransferase system IIA component
MTYEIYATVDEGNTVIVSGVPFGIGQRVKVILMTAKADNEQRVQALKALFKRTQPLPQMQNITEDEIAAEIAVYRSNL